MRHRQRFILLMSVMALTAMSLPAPLFGQSVGERVRVTLEGDKMTGTVALMNQSGFVLNQLDGRYRSVMYSDIMRLERGLYIGDYRKRGAKIGFVIGAVPGALLGMAASGFMTTPSTGEVLVGLGLGTLIFGAPSGLLGMGIGASMKKEKWETIPIPSMSGRLRISPMIDVASIGGNRRAVLGARIRF